MKKHLVLIATMTSFIALSQRADRDPNGPLEDIALDWKHRQRYPSIQCDTLYYTADIAPALIDSAIVSLRNQSSYQSDWIEEYPEPLQLTAAEITFLTGELEKQKNLEWPEAMFPKSKRIGRDEIGKSLSITERLPSEQQKNMCSIVYTFSKPIFFRDGQYCLSLKQQYYRTNYTQLSFSFYVRRYGYWQDFADLYGYYESQKED